MFSIFKKYPNLFVAFSKKSDGSMKLTDNPVLAKKIFRNRKGYFLKNNIVPQKVVSAEIVHGNKVIVVSEKDGGKIISGADGLISQNKDVFLSITSADCLPIFLFELKGEIIGMVHAGWRSLARLESARQAENILANAVEKIKKLGGIPENILVGIGPAICQKHYGVGPEVAEKFAKYPEAIKKESKKIFLDLKKIAQLQLLGLGIRKENIEISPECTFELPEKYFSARRDSPLTNCPAANDKQSKDNNKLCNQQLVRGKLKEIEAMIAVIGMKE